VKKQQRANDIQCTVLWMGWIWWV